MTGAKAQPYPEEDLVLRATAASVTARTGNFPDSRRLIRDRSAKSLAYAFIGEPVEVDRDLIRWLISESEKAGRVSARICLHADAGDPFHQMVIVQYAGLYCRPHKHPGKGEALHIIEGRLGFITFDDDGGIIKASDLHSEGALMARCGSDQWHMVLPLSERVIYHESKAGQYLAEGDSVFADWAPVAEQGAGVTAYTSVIESTLRRAATGGR